jgi:Ankyrin repeats (3 copies)/Ankyrin repeat
MRHLLCAAGLAAAIGAAGCADFGGGRDALTPLMQAAREGAIGEMTRLLDAGADLDVRDASSRRWPALLHAIHKQHPEAVRLLLERGADPNSAGAGGGTALIFAADDPDPTIVELLLEYGANPLVETRGGITALTRAVSGGALTDLTDRPLLGGCHPETVHALLTHAPSLRIADTPAGRKALWWARFNRCESVLQMVGAAQTASAR